jgi:hypothetical protein
MYLADYKGFMIPNIVMTCANAPSSPRYLYFTPEINLEKSSLHSFLPQVLAKPAGHILQPRPKLNKEKHLHLWRNKIVVELFSWWFCAIPNQSYF